MLKIFRQHTKTIIWVVVGSFILWGGYSVSALKREGRYAGEAFGKPVTFQEYNRYDRATRLFMPSEKPIEDTELLRHYAWQNIIYSREAKRNGIKITDEEVRSGIASILKQQGLLSPTPEQYKVWLTRSLNMSPREFEEGLREFMRIQKLLRVKIAGFAPEGAEKTTDAKAKEEAEEKQKIAFMTWTNDVNKRAALKDYLALPPAQENASEALKEPAPKAPADTGTSRSRERAGDMGSRPADTGTSSSRERAGDMGHRPVSAAPPASTAKSAPAVKKKQELA